MGSQWGMTPLSHRSMICWFPLTSSLSSSLIPHLQSPRCTSTIAREVGRQLHRPSSATFSPRELTTAIPCQKTWERGFSSPLLVRVMAVSVLAESGQHEGDEGVLLLHHAPTPVSNHFTGSGVRFCERFGRTKPSLWKDHNPRLEAERSGEVVSCTEGHGGHV